MFEDPIPRKRKVHVLKEYRSRCRYLIYTLNHKYLKKLLPKDLTPWLYTLENKASSQAVVEKYKLTVLASHDMYIDIVSTPQH